MDKKKIRMEIDDSDFIQARPNPTYKVNVISELTAMEFGKDVNCVFGLILQWLDQYFDSSMTDIQREIMRDQVIEGIGLSIGHDKELIESYKKMNKEQRPDKISI